ncbi:MAG: serine hydrolase [Acidobacteriia bacterium]|nr:serine hydrolase [Terriglobia bacterium]
MNHLHPMRRLLPLALLLSLGSLIQAQTSVPSDLDSFVEHTRQAFEVPGIAVAVVKDGQVVMAKGYGVRKLGDSTPVDANTLFGIASNTKAFTAAALAILVDEGKLRWDDRVIDHLANFQMSDPYVTREMTVRDLLVHRSGLGLGAGDLMFWPHTDFTRGEIIHNLRYVKLATSFRSHYAYDNVLYLVAGQIIPAVTGKPWEQFIKERLLDPLGMVHSNTSVAAFRPGDDIAAPHAKVEGKLTAISYNNLDNNAPAGALNSCVNDMTKWLIVQLNHGLLRKTSTGEERLFSERQSREMWSAQTIVPIGDPPPPLAALRPNFSAYGLGWGLTDYRGKKIVSHTGGLAGLVSRVTLVPDLKLGIVVLTNAEEGGAFQAITYHILDAYLGAPATDWVQAYLDAKKLSENRAEETVSKQTAGRNKDSKPSLPLEKYAGRYHDAWLGDVTLALENGHLVLRFAHSPGLVGDLEHWQYDTFVSRWRDRSLFADAYVYFSLKPDGSVEQMKMVPVSPLTDFSYDFQDLLFIPVAQKK